MFKLRYRFILWQATRALKKFNFGAEDVCKDVYESLDRDKKEDREMGEYINNIYFHNHGSE